jgi:HTH-type transcriptional regulator / antitoxin HipB
MSPNDDMRLRTSKDIGALIRQRRHELDLSQLELGRRVGVSRQWIVDVERGKLRAELGLVLRTLDVLELRLQVGEAPPAKERSARGPAGTDVDAVVRAARKPRR